MDTSAAPNENNDLVMLMAFAEFNTEMLYWETSAQNGASGANSIAPELNYDPSSQVFSFSTSSLNFAYCKWDATPYGEGLAVYGTSPPVGDCVPATLRLTTTFAA